MSDLSPAQMRQITAAVYDRLVDLVCDDSKDWPPQHVTRALDEMSENASVLEAWLTLQAAR